MSNLQKYQSVDDPSSTSQVVVERKLNKLVQEFQGGKHEGSVLTVATVESLTLDDKQLWRTIRKELENIGISVAAFDNNKDFILSWFQTAIEEGAFDEQIPSSPESSHSGKDPEQLSGLSQPCNGIQESASTPSATSNTSGSSFSAIQSRRLPEILSTELQEHKKDRDVTRSDSLNLLLTNRSGADPNFSKQRAPSKDGGPLSTAPSPTKMPRRPPRVVPFIAWMLRYNKDFFDACRRGDHETAMRMVKKGADIDTTGEDSTALMEAVKRASASTAQWLFDHGANINFQNSLGHSALHIAITVISLKNAFTTAQLALIQLLLQHGADVNLLDRGYESPLHRAVDMNNEETVHLLLQKGADIEPPHGDWQNSVLSLAMQRGRANLFKVLLEQGAKTTTPDQLSWLLQSAVKSPFEQIAIVPM